MSCTGNLEEKKQILKKLIVNQKTKIASEQLLKIHSSFKSNNPKVNFIKVRAFDVCTFVAFGAAQLGIAGSDIIEEFNYSEVYSPIDLNIGKCRLSVAALKQLLKKEDPKTWSNIRVATKYPSITRKHFAS